MHKGISKIIMVLVVLGLALFVTPAFTKNQTTTAAEVLDTLNPVVRTETTYVSTNTPRVEWQPNNHGGLDYHYQLTSYNEKGDSRKLELVASDDPLDANQYLKVQIRGQRVLGWQRVKPSQVPKAARQPIELQKITPQH